MSHPSVAICGRMTAIFDEDGCELLYSSNMDRFCGRECILGIDEAGRGPVLGPMVYGIAFIPVENEELLKDLGVADSKTLDEKKRDSIFGRIKDLGDTQIAGNVGYILRVLTATHISLGMFKRCKYSLNDLSHDTAALLIRKCIEAQIIITQVYIDTVGQPESYQAKLQGQFPGVGITVSKKADSLFPIVSAASICAKVTRDAILKESANSAPNLNIAEDGFGSGYPADPCTKVFMQNNVDYVFGYPTIVRTSWATAQTILDKHAATVTWEEEETGGTQSISNFFGKKSGPPKITRHPFFVERQLNSVTQF